VRAAPWSAATRADGSNALVEKGKNAGGGVMEADAADIEFRTALPGVGTDKAIPSPRSPGLLRADGPLTDKFGVGWSDGSFTPARPGHPTARMCARSRSTGYGRGGGRRYFVVDDLDRVLNPLIVRGQIHGGVIQGIGRR